MALAGALLLAGCIQGTPLEGATVDTPTTLPLGQLIAHNGTAAVDLPAAWQGLEVRLASVGKPGGEPSLGVTGDGTIFVALLDGKLARSTDHGRTWDVIETGNAVTKPKTNLDPWMWVDPFTDRVYNGPLYVVCTWLAWSDDRGETWETNPVAGCGIPAHDHQKITTGPPAEGVKTNGYPNVMYYSYNSFRQEGTWISTSLDGGKTFDVGQAVHAPSECQSGVAGPVAVAPDGTAYSPKPTCKGVDVAVSTDSGKTWGKPVSINGAGGDKALASMVDAAVDAAGNAYVAWVGGDGRTYLASSTDKGATWSEPKAVSPPGVNAAVFPVVSAGSAGRVAVGYVGTTADSSKWKSRSAEDAKDDVAWHLYVSFTEDATAANATFVSYRATPEDDPVQVGCIWQSGGGNPCRNLLDFIDMVERDGRVYLVFADGCDKCDSAKESRGRDAAVLIVERGPSLRDPAALLEPLQVALAPEGSAPASRPAGGAVPALALA